MPTLYERLEALGRRLTEGLTASMERHGIPSFATCAGSMFCVFFTAGEVSDLRGAQSTDRELFAKYFGAMVDRGVYLAPSPFESNFLSTRAQRGRCRAHDCSLGGGSGRAACSGVVSRCEQSTCRAARSDRRMASCR